MTNDTPSFVLRPSSLVLTGFMGTGKTSVGKIIAKNLGREFIDMDAVIEAREGTSINKIFETRGEAYFRRLESELCKELGARENLVIATGGGALVSAQNRSAFSQTIIVCLDASVDEIIARVGKAKDRPMIAGDAQRRILELLETRRAAYAQIEKHVDTTGKSVEQVAKDVMKLWQAN
jgi:shikimate kinase